MMERSREARRGSMATVNGGLSRRRQQRSSNLRDSPEEDGVMEMQETSRLRDRDREWGSKKDRERDRDRDRSSSRSKRRRGERLGEDSSEESVYEEEDDEEDASINVRFPPSAAVNPPPSSSSSSMHQSQNHHVRRSFSSKPARPPAPAWKVAEEMIGVSIPRKARSSSLKRSQEAGGGGGGSGELIHRQASTSPARQSPSRNTAISPSSSNASVRKKKPISGSKHRPPKISKTSSIQEIEIEVAEVLFGMTRQVPLPSSSSRQEPNHKLESKDANGFSSEAKSRVSSPASSFSPPPTTSQPSGLVAAAPKRKRPPPTSPMKVEMEIPLKAEEGLASASPSRSEKKLAVSMPAVENGGITPASADMDVAGAIAESSKQENSNHEVKVGNATTVSKSKEASSVMDAHLDEATGPICVPAAAAAAAVAAKTESPREEKFSIDLMAPPPAPPGNSEKEDLPDYDADNSLEPAKEIVGSISLDGEIEKPDKLSTHDAMAEEERNVRKLMPNDLHLKQNIEKKKPNLDLQLDLEKQDKDSLSLGGSSKHQQQMKQQSKAPRLDAKQEKSVAHPASLPLTMPVAGWPGSFPHFGYMGQVPSLPAVMQMDGSSVTAKTLQPPHFFPPPKPKRCATHCYIAQTIHYNQQIARMNPFWPPAAAVAAAAGTPPIYGAKPCNLNVMPSSEAAVLGNPLQGGFPGRSLGPLQDKASPVTMTYTGPPAKEKSSATAAVNSTLMEAHRKQFLLQQAPQPGSSAAPHSLLHGPAFIFPIGQQQAAAATRSAAAKSAPNATPNAVSASSVAAYSGPAGHPVTTTMSFNYAGLQPNDAQYLAILQNNGYPFPIPAHVGGGPSPYRGANPSQAMPFFNGSFYSSPMLHPSAQQQPRQQQQPSTHQQPLAHSQQGHQNTSTSSGSSSSQKHHSQQSQRVPGGGGTAAAPAGGNSHGFPASKQHLHLLPPQGRQLENEAGCEDSPSTADSSRASQAHKNMYGNFAMSIHPQNFALISPAAAALPSSSLGVGGGSHKDKQQPLQNQANLTPSQAYGMSFAPFGGPAAAGSAQGIDFSSMVPNHALFQSLPEAARHHGYQQMAASATGVATAAAAHVTQHKKPHQEEGKLGGDPGTVKVNVSEEGKMMVSTGKPLSSSAQHSLSFSRPDNDTPISTFAVNNSSITEGPSRNLNLIQPPANGGRAANRPSSTAPASSSAAATAANPTASSLHMQPSQQQHQLIQLQKQQQQLLLQYQMSSRSTKTSSPHSTNNVTIYSDRMPSGSAATRIPQGAIAGFPPSIIQGASGTQSPQWKASGRAATPGPTNSATASASAKNQLTQHHQQQQLQQQQQGRTQQQYQQSLLTSNAHQTQISFGVSSSKTAGVLGSSNSTMTPAAAAVASGPPQNSVSKTSIGNGGGGNGSPHASSSSKSGPPPATLLSPSLPLQPQMPAGKNSSSSSSSNLKSSPANNRNNSSNLGHPHISPAPNSSSSTKFQQPQQQKQPFHQPQHFFSNQFAAQSSQSNAAAATANYYQQHQQRRQSEQQSQQHSQQSQQQQNSTSTGVLGLCQSSATLASSSPTSEPAKATVGGVKGVQGGSSSILQHNTQYAASSMAQHPLMPSAFPYIHTMSSSVSVKPAADPKAAPGSDLKPEKR